MYFTRNGINYEVCVIGAYAILVDRDDRRRFIPAEECAPMLYAVEYQHEFDF